MIRVVVSSRHPVTAIAADPIRYHFAQLISVKENVIGLRLRRAVPDAHTLTIRSVILESLGGLTVEIDCLNISLPRGGLFMLKILEPSSLEIHVAAGWT